MICETCGQEMTIGYGLAGGGPPGPYFYCANEGCHDPKFVKFKDPEMNSPADDEAAP
jgi:hypothetical protein